MHNKNYEIKFEELEKKIYYLRKEFMIYVEQLQAMILEIETTLNQTQNNSTGD